MYKGKFKSLGFSALISGFCCKYLLKFGRTGVLAKAKDSSEEDDDSMKFKEQVKKSVKLYPGLDISDTSPGRGDDISVPRRSKDGNEILCRVAVAPGFWVHGSFGSLRSTK